METHLKERAQKFHTDDLSLQTPKTESLNRRYLVFCAFKSVKHLLTKAMKTNRLNEVLCRSLIKMRIFTLTNAELLSPGTTPITEATTTLCDQDNCSKVITFVSTAINTVSAMRINQERTIDLKTNKAKRKVMK